MRRVAIILYDDVEVLDFAGPYEVFSTASRIRLRMDNGAEAPFVPILVGHGEQVRARGDFRVKTHHTFANAPKAEILLVPGGIHEPVMEDETFLGFIADRAERSEIVASVCTGAFLLAKAGVLGSCRVTTHWDDIAELRRGFPELDVRENVRWVDNGKIVTSAGISAGIDMALHLVARLEGEELAERTARLMEFDRRKTP